MIALTTLTHSPIEMNCVSFSLSDKMMKESSVSHEMIKKSIKQITDREKKNSKRLMRLNFSGEFAFQIWLNSVFDKSSILLFYYGQF